MRIDHKCNRNVKYYSNRKHSKEHPPQFKLDKNKHRGVLSKIANTASKERHPQITLAFLSTKINKHRDALSKNTIFYKNFSSGEWAPSLFAISDIFTIWFARIFIE